MSYRIVEARPAYALKEGPFLWKPRIAFMQVVRGWSQTAGVNSVRFEQPLMLTDTTGLLFLNERAAVIVDGEDTNNDGEDGFRISLCPFSIDLAAKRIPTGSNVLVYQPPGWETATGSAYCPQPVQLPNGSIVAPFNLLRSASGKVNDVPAYLDLYLTYTDDPTGLTGWQTPVLIKTAEQFYTENGLPVAGGSGIGLECNGTNNIVRMADGRIVLAGQANGVGSNCYLGSIYTDDPDGLTGWTWGTPLLVDPAHGYNEQAVTEWFDGTLRAFGRPAAGNGRGEFSSPRGEGWTYLGFRADLPIQNVNACAWLAGDRVFLGGSTDTNASYRDRFKFMMLDSASAVTGTRAGLVPDVLRLGYAAGTHRNGLNVLAGELAAGAKDTSFNAEDSAFIAVFNNAAADSDFHESRASDAVLYPQGPTALFNDYKAWVEGDGGTIYDETACLAAFTRAYNGNYLSIAAAVSPQWGWKGTGAADTVLYDIGPLHLKTSSVGISASMTFHTTLGPRSLAIPNANAFLKMDLPLRVGDTMGAMMVDLASPMDATGSLGIVWTKGGVVHTMMPGHGIFTIGSEYRLESNPEYPTAAADAVHIFADFGRSYALMGVNGVDDKAQPYIPATHFAAGEVGTISITVAASDGTPRELAELWFFYDGPLEPMIQAGEDAGAIY